MQHLWRDHVDERLAREAREFTREHVAPVADALDRDDRYPLDLVRLTAERGWNAMTLDPRHGGGGRPMTELLAVLEELSCASAILGISLITIFQSQRCIELYGEESLKERYLPRYAGGLPASFALTEDAHGSDIRQLDTKAHRTDRGWVLNGEKAFITSGAAAELFVVLAQTSVGVSTFAVAKDTPGVSSYEGQDAETFGLRNGPHVNLVLQDVEVPADHLIGTEGRGLKQVMVTLANSRTLAAGISLGIARAAFEGALQYVDQRSAFGTKVLDFQGIQWYFAELAAQIDATRLLTYEAARDLDAGRDIARSSSSAKLLAASLATKVASTAVQVCGAHGTRETQPFGRYLRDAKAYEVAGGSAEVLKNTVAKSLVKAVRVEDR
ncbi:acyl-CoA dehydrogenase family protein [Amycolatopsis sp. FDAARGOS 1241]|uniref:acyl-CoA dehydrogenase family protein n=1 Tax=Amycolatopsis sp. FDAARGOS 1241 TaxID=2778070 RepID=UPI00194EF1DC|nr:acyl-CoA dehydrogenase family protein [Amycolatopsis sp. FDAARGOS 1241]QRP43306.1 acyl-CoA dehydrogenase family protein [Amycolatopsis sp. FDAARGOS 1241]